MGMGTGIKVEMEMGKGTGIGLEMGMRIGMGIGTETNIRMGMSMEKGMGKVAEVGTKMVTGMGMGTRIRMGTRIGSGNGDRNKRRDGNLMGTGTRMGMGMERGKGQKGKGSSLLPAFPPAAGSASSGNEQRPCPRLPRLGGEGFSSAEGLRVRHQKADGKEQVIFISMSSALLFHLENPWIILLFALFFLTLFPTRGMGRPGGAGQC